MVTPTRRLILAGGMAALGSITLGGRCDGAAAAATLMTVPEPLPAPDLAGPLLDGSHWALERFRSQLVVVSFWAVWCPPCRREMPALARLSRDLAQHRTAVVAVNLGDSAGRIGDFLSKLEDTDGLPILLDTKRRSAADWRVIGLPMAYVVDARGRIRLAGLGAPDWDSPALRQQLLSVAN